MLDCSQIERELRIPTIHVVSDSLGATAHAVARAASAQFGVTNPKIETLGKVKSYEEIESFLERHSRHHVEQLGEEKMLVFYTLVNTHVREKVSEYVESHPHILAVDLMTDAVTAISEVSGMQPALIPGSLYTTDVNYFRRIEAIEFTIAHDDGRNPQELTQADIVLLGVSRSSKTPTSIYLAQQGYKVANIPLDPSTEPPREVFDVDRTRLFGLMTTADVLVDIRQRRLGKAQSVIAGSYADPEYVYNDLEKARKLMRQLGCIIVRTEKRAVEETAQEILRYYERSHPSSTDIID